jgi:hypothetical protein
MPPRDRAILSRMLPLANTATDWISAAASCVGAAAALAPYIKMVESIPTM